MGARQKPGGFYLWIPFYQPLQGANIALFIAVVIDRRLRNEGAMGEAGIVEQAAERLFADGSFADVLVAIEPGAARGLGVVAMPHPHWIEANRSFNLDHRVLVAIGGYDVITGHMGMTGIEADRYRRMITQQHHKFGHLVEAASQGTLR